MARNHLTAKALDAIKPGDVRKRLNDGDGLHLLLFVKGGSHGWRLAYTFEGRRNILSLGTYPEISLGKAREKASAARQQLVEGVDPSQARKAVKAQRVASHEAQKRQAAGLPTVDSFEHLAREWYASKSEGWSPGYASKVLTRLETDVFPYIGHRPIQAITAEELLDVLRRIERRGVVETVHRALESCSQVFKSAMNRGKVQRDPGQALKAELRALNVQHFPAITSPDRLAQLLRAIDGYAGTPVVRTALYLAPMLLLRPGELRQAQWPEIDLAGALFTVPAERMKRTKAGKQFGKPHLVPLPRQAVKALADLQQLTGDGQWVFRGERHHDRPMSENTVNAALRAMGFPQDEATGHGFRATARTMLAERLGVDEAVIEAQLAHSVRDSLGRAYNRTQFMDQRRVMLQTWADYLDRLRAGGVVVPLAASPRQ